MKSKCYVSKGDGTVALTEVEIAEPKKNDLLIKIKSFGLNRVDILQAKGLYQAPPGSSEILGLEFSGEVFQVGGHGSQFKVGDRVCGLTSAGSFAEYITLPENLVIKLPNNLSFVQGAAIPEAWITAYFNLLFLNKVSASDTILIHSAAGGVGLAAIQIALAKNATVLAVTGSENKVKYLRDSFKPLEVFNYKKDGYENLKDAYGGKVTFVLDTIGPSALDLHTKLLARGGIVQTIGLLGGNSAQFEMGSFLKKNLTIFSSTLRSQDTETKLELTKKLSAEIMPGLASGSFKVPIFKELSATSIDEGFKLMISNEIIGKIVYSWAL